MKMLEKFQKMYKSILYEGFLDEKLEHINNEVQDRILFPTFLKKKDSFKIPKHGTNYP